MLNSKSARSIFSNTIYQTIGKVATLATTIVVTMLVTRKYGAQGYGQLSIILTFPALFFIVADFGMNAIVAGEIAKDASKTNRLFNNLLTLRSVFAALLALLGILVLQFFPYPRDVKLAAMIILPTVITFSIYTSTNALYQANSAYNRSMVGPVARSAAVLLAVLILMSRNVSAVGLTCAFIFGDLFLGGVSLLLVRKFAGKVRLAWDKETIKYILLASLPLGLAAITNPIIGKADTLILSILKTEADVGYYNLAYKVFEVALVVPVFFVNAAYPYMVRHYSESKEKLLATSKKLFVVLLGMGLAALLLVWVAAPLIVMLLGGNGFEASILPLRILSLSFPIFYLTNLFLWYLITIGKRRPIPSIYWCAVILNISANLIIIPRFNFIGAAVVNGLTELFVLAALAICVKKDKPSHRR